MVFEMVDFKLKIHEKQGTMYVPKEIREALGLDVKATPNRRTVFLYPKGMPIEDVVKSLILIKEELEHAIELEKKAGA